MCTKLLVHTKIYTKLLVSFPPQMLTLPIYKLALGLFVEIDLNFSETYAFTPLSLSLSLSLSHSHTHTHTHTHRDVYTQIHTLTENLSLWLYRRWKCSKRNARGPGISFQPSSLSL
jgi:hypothetical protein